MGDITNSSDKIVKFRHDLEKGANIRFEELDSEDEIGYTEKNQVEEVVNRGNFHAATKEWIQILFKSNTQLWRDQKIRIAKNSESKSISSRKIVLWAQGIHLGFLLKTMFWLNRSYYDPEKGIIWAKYELPLFVDVWVYILAGITTIITQATMLVLFENIFFHMPYDHTKRWYFDKILAIILFLNFVMGWVTDYLLSPNLLSVMHIIWFVLSEFL